MMVELLDCRGSLLLRISSVRLQDRRSAPTTIDRCVDAMGHSRSWTKQPINPSLSEEVVGQEHIGCESLQALD
jgi:hypothetical protein